MGGESKADTTPLLLFLNFDVMFAILYFSLNLDKGLGPERSRKYVFYSTVQIADPDNLKSKSIQPLF